MKLDKHMISVRLLDGHSHGCEQLGWDRVGDGHLMNILNSGPSKMASDKVSQSGGFEPLDTFYTVASKCHLQGGPATSEGNRHLLESVCHALS